MISMDNFVLSLPLRKARTIFEKEYLSQVIIKYSSIAEAAKIIGMDRTALHYKLKHLGLKVVRYDDETIL
jgi:DNA-binding NtrC family response regulator